MRREKDLDFGDAQSGEQDLRVLEMGHRFRNDLQAISTLAESELKQCRGSAEAPRLERVVGRILAVSVLYQHLRSTASESVDFVEYLSTVCERIADTLQPDVCTMQISVDLMPIQLEAERATLVAIAVNELIANASKHAFTVGKPGLIAVRLLQVMPGKLAVCVSDDGCGLTVASTDRRGLGIVQRLVLAAGGTLTRGHGPGTNWIITLRQDDLDRKPSYLCR